MIPAIITLIVVTVLGILFWRNVYDAVRGKEIYDDLYLFNTKLTEMVKLELPLDEGIKQIVSDVFETATYKLSKIRKPLKRVAERISTGKTLGEALDWERGYFPNYYVSMIRIGESENKLISALETLNVFLKTKREFNVSVFQMAGFYIITTLVMFSTVIFVSKYITPTFITLFEGMQQDTTVLKLTGYISGIFPIIAVITLLLVIGGVIMRKSKEFSRHIDKWLVKIPVVKDLIKNYEYMVFSRVMSKLLENWIPLDNALILSSGAAENFIYSEAVKNTANVIDANLTDSLKRAGVFDDNFVFMASLGEKTENLAETFNEMADYYAASYNMMVKKVIRLTEVGTTVIIGMFASFFAITMFTPLFGLINQMVKNIVVY
ncbi:MAG: type II secretion system F family protein [Firmicutes bacterium]|nr:type II secretion system F family protein [Bacillota bacterium]